KDSFKKHVDSLLKIGAIRPSKSRHRMMAMIVNSRTTIDPETGKEVKGKERMVFNYKSLNDNTYKDQYSLPGINAIIKRIGGAKIFSKFNLKSGFHQVAMDEESIPWTAFLVPGGLYEWLVMPFGLKNAPAVFQRKMDKCFKGTESFIAVYIDDILVFSKNEKEHAKHLEKMLKICEDNGLVLSPTKMKIAVSTIDFLRVVIGEGMIKLQPHIIKKIVNFNEEELKTKKGLRMKSSDYELVRKIKEQVQNLPDLEIPPENAYIILETDGCIEG
nr:retrotransposon protein, putative, Ty3-gypsy subclass [Tanacetum cinerariifolium]